MDFAELLRKYPWRPIRNCPGRYSLAMDAFGGAPEALAPGHGVRKHRCEAARDVVAVVEIEGGGLISYSKPDGRWLHTLNTDEGFRRKLEEFGIRKGD